MQLGRKKRGLSWGLSCGGQNKSLCCEGLVPAALGPFPASTLRLRTAQRALPRAGSVPSRRAGAAARDRLRDPAAGGTAGRRAGSKGQAPLRRSDGAEGSRGTAPVASHLPGAAHSPGVAHRRLQALPEGCLPPGHGRQPQLARLRVPWKRAEGRRRVLATPRPRGSGGPPPYRGAC